MIPVLVGGCRERFPGYVRGKPWPCDRGVLFELWGREGINRVAERIWLRPFGRRVARMGGLMRLAYPLVIFRCSRRE
jgi:hypothetical protein